MSDQKDKVVTISVDEYWEHIKDDYFRKISNKSPSEVYPSLNPGPETADGGVNFECHCVGHLVGSPCGFEFREAISCQKSSSDEQMQEGACGKELLSFMECVTRTQCFKTPSSSAEDGK